jgi:sugar lactone lactonase YvrE
MARSSQTLISDIYFGEGPRWRDGRLWFSDFYAFAVKSVGPAGDVQVEFTWHDRTSGLGWTPAGDLLFVSMTDRKLMRRTPAGEISLHADLGGIATFHCNDMVVDAAGGAYVGNFGFDLDHELVTRGAPSVIADHPKAKLAYVAPGGRVSVAAEDMSFPNGTVITPDGKTLIIGESLGGRLTAFDIAADGSLSNRRVWADLSGRVPDGICLDADGAIWVACALAPECVRVAEGGEVLDLIDTGDNCYACMLGGMDGKTLYMLTAPSSIAEEAAKAPLGKLVTASAPAPRAGQP